MSGTAGRPTTSNGPTFDSFDNTPELIPLRTAAQSGDWNAVRAYFSGLDSVDKVSSAVATLADIDGAEFLLQQAAADHPGDPLPRAALAERYVYMGWDIRSSLQAKHVSSEQFDRFHAWLRKAEQILIEVCAEQPSYAPAWTARLMTARGLQLGQAEARRRYDRLSAHHPHHYRAQVQLLQQVCPKWSGSWEAAHGFARECATASPDGSNSGALVALAHIEHWLDLDGPAGTAYMRGIPVRDDLRNAARISVLHPDHRPDWNSLGAHNAFAFAFSLGGHFEDAAPHFAYIGDRATESPWYYTNDKKAAFLKHRKSALGA
ncbi:tetratricopeptide repeat protein [Streptomyces sp. T028]|uniref:tetratricopeptide repeat protein n=1 Tax=Streptomyces sp. T028 TaxID=3394379 RepID=UPI003A8A917F